MPLHTLTELSAFESPRPQHGAWLVREIQDAVLIGGPKGKVERIRIGSSDSPQAIEHCLRTTFAVPRDAAFVLRDASGCIVPLGIGLLSFRHDKPQNHMSQDHSKPTYHVHVLDDEHRTSPANVSKRSPCGRNIPLGIPEVMRDDVADDECQFWCALVAGFERATSKFILGPALSESNVSKQFWRMARFDTSPHRMDNLFQQNSDIDGGISFSALRDLLAKDYNIRLSEEQMLEAIHRVRMHARRGFPGDKRTGRGDGQHAKDMVPRRIFESLWQRLMLGVVCTMALLQRPSNLTDPDIVVYEYSEKMFKKEYASEQALFFALPPRIWSIDDGMRDMLTRWARIDRAGQDRVVRMGVKFFLHPLATEDAVDTMKMGMTKIDRYRHQYFVSLEVYALSDDTMASRASDSGDVDEPMKVSDHVVRSPLFLVATTNPRNIDTSSGVGYRDWLLSLVNMELLDTKVDPLDCFARDARAATKILDRVAHDLKSQGRLREYMADFLMYTILDRAVTEMIPICNAYSHRLCWLAGRLKKEKTALPTKYVDEVSRMRLEIKELQQWVRQTTIVLDGLERDCKGISDGSAGSEAPWSFGAWAVGSGKSILLFLRDTKDSLQQRADRLVVLEELARSFAKDHRRHMDMSMNEALFILAFATSIFLPAQFLAGVYGMNFVTEDGKPALPELQWRHGYLYFWVLSGTLISVFAASICTIRKRQARCCRCCCYFCTRRSTKTLE